MDENKIYWVRGNTQELLIPLEQEIVPEEGEIQVEPYYPAEGATVTVCLVGKYKKYTYTPTIDGNLLRFTESGTISAGLYGVEVLVNNPDGTQHRSLWDNQIVVTNQNDSVLQEWDEFRQLDIKARAAVFFFAKGDPFTYQDFTPEEIEELQKPARDATAEITDDYALLKEDYNTNVKDDYATVKQDAQQATSDANNAAQNANGKAGEANDAATNANEKATYAKNQGDYAKEKANEIEDAKGTYQTLDARLGAMEADTDNRFERITQEQFNEIFT